MECCAAVRATNRKQLNGGESRGVWTVCSLKLPYLSTMSQQFFTDVLVSVMSLWSFTCSVHDFMMCRWTFANWTPKVKSIKMRARIDQSRKTIKEFALVPWSTVKSLLADSTLQWFFFRSQDTKLHFTSIIMDTSTMWTASALSVGFRCKEFWLQWKITR